MPLFRESSFLVVHPGSQHTIFSFGLQDPLSPPQYKIPSVVYQDPNTREYKSKKNEAEELIEIHPIKESKIIDLDAFNYLLKVILQSVITNNPVVTINQIPLLLIAPSLAWSRSNIEYVTKYVIESLEFTAFNILDLSIACNFGMGSSASSCVVNVGHESCQIMPVIGYQSIKYAGIYLNGVGGKTINEEVQKLLPNLTSKQIDALKTSGIFEAVNDHDSSFYSVADLNTVGENNEEEEDFDVAKIVTEQNGNLPNSDSAANEGEEKKEEAKSNSELEKNFFLDPDTNEKIYVGKERFQGASKLVNHIAEAIYESLLLIPDLEKRQECYDNLIFVGSTFKIPGLKQALLIKLTTDYLVRSPGESTANNDTTAINSAIVAYQQAEELNESNGESNFILSQVPTAIRTAKHPDYFPEWKQPKEKGGSWEDVYFLGAEIYAKQIFGGNSNQGGELFLDADGYEEKGPQGIWDATI
ncbi:unnamed protein product [Debaryomyces tyrocola]|nr:unnamed protein product [Debaryomyces tyrocola]